MKRSEQHNEKEPAENKQMIMICPQSYIKEEEAWTIEWRWLNDYIEWPAKSTVDRLKHDIFTRLKMPNQTDAYPDYKDRFARHVNDGYRFHRLYKIAVDAPPSDHN